VRKILVALAALAVAVPLSIVTASPAGANSPGWSDRCIYMPDWYATVCVNAYTASYGTGVHVTQVQVCAFHNNDPGDHLRGTYNMAFETNNGGTALNGDAPGACELNDAVARLQRRVAPALARHDLAVHGQRELLSREAQRFHEVVQAGLRGQRMCRAVQFDFQHGVTPCDTARRRAS